MDVHRNISWAFRGRSMGVDGRRWAFVGVHERSVNVGGRPRAFVKPLMSGKETQSVGGNYLLVMYVSVSIIVCCIEKPSQRRRYYSV